MKRLFSDLNMTWLKVILFAIVAGVYTGAVMLIPFLKDTSFQDIGISYEWWIIFAVIIVVNCKKCWEAMLKCFVFFLISQPLIYAVEVISGHLAFNLACNYYLHIWLPMTLLTLPGGLIAYFCNKQNILGGIILGIANAMELVLAMSYFGMAINHFPNHLLSGVVCIASIFVMTLSILKEIKYRVVAFMVPVVLGGVLLVLLRMTGRVLF